VITAYIIGQMELLTAAHHTGVIMVDGCKGLTGIAPAAATAAMTQLISEGPVAVAHNAAVGIRSSGPGNPMMGRVARIQ
jgi:hypothetical protein